ncbi:MAG: DUF475 domain-containing protein, partial [Pseudomonadota bacterium]|nr:DUF475 domain-containing protein [Pseudomonadota bacterium]
MLRYFAWPFLFTAIGLVLCFWLGWFYSGTLGGALAFLLTGAILAVLEISLSFDNAVVNAHKLKTMRPEWQRRFLTWGILIAVFGMRIVFPLLIVVIAAKIGPVSAVVLAASDPDAYAAIISDAHLPIAAFGGSFLMMVALTYFVDDGKEVDWIRALECKLRACASIRGLEIAFVLAIAVGFTLVLPGPKGAQFLFAAVCGLLTFLVVEFASHFLDNESKSTTGAATGGFGAFMYLEVLDASFSFDGVIGAFAPAFATDAAFGSWVWFALAFAFAFAFTFAFAFAFAFTVAFAFAFAFAFASAFAFAFAIAFVFAFAFAFAFAA